MFWYELPRHPVIYQKHSFLRNNKKFKFCWWNKVKVLVAQSCPTLCDPMDCSLPGFSVHGILQATTLEWVPIHFSRDSSWPRDWTWVSRIAGRFFTVWAIREALILLEANLILVYCFGRACPLETGSKACSLAPLGPSEPSGLWGLVCKLFELSHLCYKLFENCLH